MDDSYFTTINIGCIDCYCSASFTCASVPISFYMKRWVQKINAVVIAIVLTLFYFIVVGFTSLLYYIFTNKSKHTVHTFWKVPQDRSVRKNINTEAY